LGVAGKKIHAPRLLANAQTPTGGIAPRRIVVKEVLQFRIV
jgi:hypothetical protein